MIPTKESPAHARNGSLPKRLTNQPAKLWLQLPICRRLGSSKQIHKTKICNHYGSIALRPYILKGFPNRNFANLAFESFFNPNMFRKFLCPRVWIQSVSNLRHNHMGVSKNRGVYPQNVWFIMENPIKMDDLGGFTTPIFGSTPIFPPELARWQLTLLSVAWGQSSFRNLRRRRWFMASASNDGQMLVRKDRYKRKKHKNRERVYNAYMFTLTQHIYR